MNTKLFFLSFAITFLLVACNNLPFQKLISTTNIKANDAFILGNNEHGKFNVRINNISNTEIAIWQVPITGGQHSPIKLNAKQKVEIKVDRNTAIRIENPSSFEIAVELVVKGDIGLSMGYKH
jgi:LEA14-like dessication related protein